MTPIQIEIASQHVGQLIAYLQTLPADQLGKITIGETIVERDAPQSYHWVV
jgi:hypothetical protein